MKKIITTLSIALTIVASVTAFAQNRMVFNASNVYLRISNSANLVLDNSNTNAITTSAGANIISEGENNVVKWRVGTGTGTYTVPYTTNSLVKIPLKINITAAGTGTANSIIFSTYETFTDANTIYPSDVTNMNSNCNNNNALYAIDRFWRIDAASYGASKPTPVINFGFNPAANETGVTNTIVTSKLKAERFNSGSWETPQKLYGLNSLNTVAGVSVTPADFFKSWTLIDTTIMTIPITTSVPNSTICEGLSFVATPSGATNYTLTVGSLTTTTNFTVSPLATTIYTVNGSIGSGSATCKSAPSSAAVFTVNVNTAPTITTTAATSATICSGQSYTISNLSGGTGNYTLTNTNTTNTTQFVVTPTASITYTIIGGNANGCISTTSSDLNVSITVNATPTITTSGATSGTICSGESFTISPLSGSGTGSYTLVPGGSTTTTNFVVSPSSTTTYSIIGANANGCISLTSSDLNVALTVKSTPTVAALFSSNALCSAQNVTITLSGANGIYTLTPGTQTVTSPSNSFVVTPAAGTTIYTITANNTNGCISTYSNQYYTTSVSVVTNPTITASAITNSICAGSTASITPFGATTFTVINSANATTYTVASGQTFTDTPTAPTTYTINGTATGGCYSIPSTQFVTTIGINANPTVSAVSALSNTICTGLTTTLTASGATSYTWTGGPTASNYQVTPNATTVYTVVGTNASGCSNGTSPLTLTVSVLSSPTLALSTSINTNTLCSGNTATITLGGASAGSTYTLFPGSSTSTSSFVLNPVTTQTYVVIATDNSNGCVSTTSSQVYTTMVNVSASPTIALSSASPSSTICSGQSATITVTGGIAGTYTLVNSPTATEPFIVMPNATTTYTISGAGSNGCISTSSSDLQTIITVNQSPTLTASSQQDALCFGGSTGSVTLTTTGGTGTSTITPSTTSGLSAGSYTYISVDPLGCISETVITISQPTAAVTAASAVETASNSNCVTFNGSASVLPAGGTPTYNVTWSGGQTGTSVTGLSTGVNSYTITDSNGCTNSALTGTINITGVIGINTTASSQSSVSCMTGTNGAITFTTTGGGPDTYTLTSTSTSTTFTSTTGVFTGLPADSYSVYVIGSGGCVATQIISITQPTTSVTLSNSAVSVGTVNCFGGTAIVTATATGGVGSYTYNWSGNASVTTNTVNYAAGGPYTVTVMDANNCSTSSTPQTFTISQPSSSVSVASIANTTVACNGGTTSITALATGGTGSYTYQWQLPSVSTSSISTYTGGTYTMTITDLNGCASATQTFVVTQPSNALTINEVTVAPTCATQNTGMVEIMPVGGTANYTVVWSNGATTFTLANLTEGPISAVVTDTNGCVASYNTNIAKENCIKVVISQLLSPNGDGINEPFMITGLEQYPNNKLEIYNRWGSLIYSKVPYDNTFNGKANISGVLGTGLLPSATYFVVFDFGDGITPIYKGYLELKY